MVRYQVLSCFCLQMDKQHQCRIGSLGICLQLTLLATRNRLRLQSKICCWASLRGLWGAITSTVVSECPHTTCMHHHGLTHFKEYRRSCGICLIWVFPSHKGKRRERSSRSDSAKHQHSSRHHSCHNDEDPSHSDAAGGLSCVHPGNLTSHGYQGPSGEQIQDLHQFAQRHADLTPRDLEHFTAPSHASYQDQRFSRSVVTQLQKDASLGATRLQFDEYPQPETSCADNHGIADAFVAMRQHSYQPSNNQSNPSRWTPLHVHQPGPVSQCLVTPDLANDLPLAIQQIAPQSLLPDPHREGMCNASAGMDQIAFQPLDLDLYRNSIFNASLGLEQIATQPYVYKSNGGGNMHRAHHDAATFLPVMDQVSAPEYHSNMQNAEYV